MSNYYVTNNQGIIEVHSSEDQYSKNDYLVVQVWELFNNWFFKN